MDGLTNGFCGGRGIRTPGTISRTPVFKTGAFNQLCHSSWSIFYALIFSECKYTFPFAKTKPFLAKNYLLSGYSRKIPASLASQIPLSVIKPLTKRAGVTSKP